MNFSGWLTVRLLNFFEQDGSVYEEDVRITANDITPKSLIFNNLFVKNLDGADDVIEYFQIEAVVRPDGEFTVLSSDSIVVDMQSDSIFFKSVRGILAPRTFDFDPVEKNDILDVEGTTEELGKNIKSDLDQQKATYPALYGLSESKTMANKLIDEAKISLQIFAERAQYFHQLADYIISRTH